MIVYDGQNKELMKVRRIERDAFADSARVQASTPS
mgnify:CR=1 FL=1